MAGKLTPKKVALALRRRQAVQLRVVGYTFTQIAGLLGYSSKAAAYNAVAKELADARQEEVDALRKIEHKRIEAIILSIWPACVGNPSHPTTLDSIKVYLGLSARLAKLHGLDVATSGGGGEGAKAEANVTFVQIGSGQPKRIEELTDQELLALIATLDKQPIIEGEAKVLPEGDGDHE